MDIPKNIYAGDNFIVKSDNEELLLQIVEDSNPDSPRNWDNVGTMVCWHRKYSLGDQHHYHDPEEFLRSIVGEDVVGEHEDEDGYVSIETLLELAQETHCILPLYLYDHSGITISTGKFLDTWDTSMVGWIYVSKDKALENYANTTEENWRSVAEQHLKGEVQVYDHYITGAVLGYQIYRIEDNEATDFVDSCYGFYGHSTKDNGMFNQLAQYTLVRSVEVKNRTTTRTYIVA